MAEQPEPFSLNVGSKLLFFAIMLMVFGVLVLVLMPLGTAFAPAPPPGAEPGPGIVGALMPGIILLIVGVVLGALAGLCLGYAKAKHPSRH